MLELYGQGDIEPFVVSMFMSEIIEKNKELEFEEFLK